MNRLLIRALRMVSRRVIWGSLFGLITLVFGRSQMGRKVRRSLNMIRRMARF